MLANPLRRVVAARPVGEHSVWLQFDDDLSGTVDLAEAIERVPQLRRLRDETTFAQLRVEFGTLAWPGDLDWAPESLYAMLREANGLEPQSIGSTPDLGSAQIARMPEISRFFGIVVQMLYNDHQPPHFHATYGGYEISVVIATCEVTGRFPGRALRMVLEWLDAHEDELMSNWERMRAGDPPEPIAPLE